MGPQWMGPQWMDPCMDGSPMDGPPHGWTPNGFPLKGQVCGRHQHQRPNTRPKWHPLYVRHQQPPLDPSATTCEGATNIIDGPPPDPPSPPLSRNGRGGQPPLCKRPKYKAEKEGEAGRGWAWPPHHLRGGRLLIQRVGEMAIHLSQRERENSEVAGSPTGGVHHWSFVLESWGGGSNRSDVP